MIDRELKRLEISWLVLIGTAVFIMWIARQEDWFLAAFRWLFYWQTLAGAGIALIGAWFTIRKIREQIELSDKHESARVRRMYQARLAALPLTLSSLCEYLKEIYQSLEAARALQRVGGNPALVQSWSYPELSATHLSELQRFLEATDNYPAIRLVTGVFQQLQTLHARIRDLRDPVNMAGLMGVQRNLVEYQFQAATIYSMIEVLFPYARLEVESPPTEVSRSDVISRLDILRNSTPNDLEFTKRLKSFSAPDTPAWPRNL